MRSTAAKPAFSPLASSARRASCWVTGVAAGGAGRLPCAARASRRRYRAAAPTRPPRPRARSARRRCAAACRVRSCARSNRQGNAHRRSRRRRHVPSIAGHAARRRQQRIDVLEHVVSWFLIGATVGRPHLAWGCFAGCHRAAAITGRRTTPRRARCARRANLPRWAPPSSGIPRGATRGHAGSRVLCMLPRCRDAVIGVC